MLILQVSEDSGHASKIQRELVEHGVDWQLAWMAPVAALSSDMIPDVLLCSARVGSIDGLMLLAQLHARYPEAMRILLMVVDQDQDIMQAMEVSQRVLPEPLETASLVDAVESFMELRALLDNPALQKAIGRIGSLPAAPRLYLALTHLLRDPDVSAARVAEVIAQDPGVAAKVLRMTNSAYYSAGRETTDLRTAIARLGQNVLRHLVLASEAFSANSAEGNAIRDRALRISRLAGQLLAGPSAELAATAGLLAEVGLLLPPLKSDDGATISHGAAGAYLLGLWGLPSPIVEAVAFHQCPAGISGFWVTGAVHVAAALINGSEIDEAYLRSVGQLDHLPRWRALADAQTEAT